MLSGGLLWVQPVWHSDGIPESFFYKLIYKNLEIGRTHSKALDKDFEKIGQFPLIFKKE